MPHSMEAQNFPEFPTELPTAHLPRLSLSKLFADDVEESQALFEACRTTGFFAIDLSDHVKGAKLLGTANHVFGIAEEFFNLDDSEKREYSFAPDRPYFGYKAVGISKVDTKGTPDRCEGYGISRDDLLALGPSMAKPACVESRHGSLKAFIMRSHDIVELISSVLDRNLGLPQGTLASLQPLSKRSGSLVRMIKTPPKRDGDHDTSFLAHTDVGSITVLFNVLGGLQILPPGGRVDAESDWRFVRPEPGCAIINLGDTMVHWTNGALRSNLHRVTYPPGEQAKLTRYSVAYFARSETGKPMAALNQSDLVRSFADEVEEEPFTPEEWERQKARAVLSGKNMTVSSGGKHK